MRKGLKVLLVVSILVGLAIVTIGAVSGCGSTKTTTNDDSTNAASAGEIADTVKTTSVPEVTQKVEIVGFGATREDWDKNHEMADGYSKGSAYLPMVNGKQPKYSGVTDIDGRILNYTVNFDSGTSQQTANTYILAEFPKDAKMSTSPVTTGDRCQIFEVRTNTLESVLKNKIPVAAFYSGSGSFTPASIKYVILTYSVPGAAPKSC